MVRKEKSPLSDLENKVMTIVWEHAEVTAEQVRSKIKLDAPPKESTIRTILSRLKRKATCSTVPKGAPISIQRPNRLTT